MRIALVILHADPARGGAERYTVDLAAGLARRGHEVSLLAGSFAGETPAGARRVAIAAGGLTRVGQYARFLDALDGHLDANPYDVVHAMLPVRRCDVYHPHAGMAAEQLRKWNRLLNPRRGRMAAVERELFTGGGRTPVVIALSEYVKRSILEHYPLPADRLVALFNAVDLERFRPGVSNLREHAREGLEDPDNAVAGLMIANDFERKGLEQAIRAVAAVNDPRLSLDVIGRQDPSRYKRLAAELRADVRFCGQQRFPQKFYDAADFFVLPTRHDPCSLVVLEALAMGLPVISTKFNGACEIMTDGVHGFVLPDPSDVDALANAMRQMLNDDRRRAMAQACVELRPRLAYDKHLDDLLAIYARVGATAVAPG